MSSPNHEKVAHFIGMRHTNSGSTLGGRLTLFFVCKGGNSLDKAPLGTVHDFVREHGGHTVITKVGYTHFELFGDCGVPLGTRVRCEPVFHYVSYYVLDTVKLQRIPSCRVSNAVDFSTLSFIPSHSMGH